MDCEQIIPRNSCHSVPCGKSKLNPDSKISSTVAKVSWPMLAVRLNLTRTSRAVNVMTSSDPRGPRRLRRGFLFAQRWGSSVALRGRGVSNNPERIPATWGRSCDRL